MRLLKKSSILSFIIFNLIFSKHNIEIINNSKSVLTIKLSNSAKTQADLFVNHIFVGLPDKKLPKIELLSSQISNSTFPLEPQIGKTYDWIGVQKHKNLNVGILKINPIINSNSYYKEIILKVSFSSSRSVFRQSDNNEKKTLSNKIINWDIAKNWFLENEVRPRINIANSESGDWIIFDVKTDGIKHLSYNQLKRIYKDNIMLKNSLTASREAMDKNLGANYLELGQNVLNKNILVLMYVILIIKFIFTAH